MHLRWTQQSGCKYSLNSSVLISVLLPLTVPDSPWSEKWLFYNFRKQSFPLLPALERERHLAARLGDGIEALTASGTNF